MRGIFLTLAIIGVQTAAAGTVVDLGYAKYRGSLSLPNTVAFLGLPYAEPPLGQQRFRSPVPLDVSRVTRSSHGSIINATSYPAFCVQGTTASVPGGAGSEDCLNVNVYAPLNASAGDTLPILVYIHGGGYRYGNPAQWPFEHWVEHVPEVVIVSVYYRLGAFGFLAHPDFESTPELGDFNVGFLDQVEALKWVRRHIYAFGGDPARVTVNGQSAGASSIMLHLVSPVSEGLFSGAIAQSVFRTSVPTPEQQEPLFNTFSAIAGCNMTSTRDKMDCLRKADVSALAPAQDISFNGSLPYNAWHPVLDGKIITQLPTLSILQSSTQRMPLIVGSTSNETLSPGTDLISQLKAYFPALTDADLAEYLRMYPQSDFVSASQQARDGTGESELRCAVEIMSDSFSQHSGTFAYRYNTPNPTKNTSFVEHSADNWMLFRGTNVGPNGTTTFTSQTLSEEAFAEEMIAYWLSFVRSGNPNTHKLARSPSWPEYHIANTRRLVLTEGSETETGSVVELMSEAEKRRCDFVAGKVLAHEA